MKEFSTLFNTTNTFIPRRDDVEEIIAAALNAADPYTRSGIQYAGFTKTMCKLAGMSIH